MLRAFTTAAYAVAGGVERVVLAASVDDMRRLQLLVPHALTLTDGPRQPGIDLVNSPALVAAHTPGTDTLIMATTNGTVAALDAADSEPLLCAAFVNARATADQLRSDGRPARFVPSGGPDADEDASCGEYIAALMTDPHTDPLPYLDRARHSAASSRLRQRVVERDSGVHADDVEYCLRADIFDFALLGVRTALGIELTVAASR